MANWRALQGENYRVCFIAYSLIPTAPPIQNLLFSLLTMIKLAPLGALQGCQKPVSELCKRLGAYLADFQKLPFRNCQPEYRAIVVLKAEAFRKLCERRRRRQA